MKRLAFLLIGILVYGSSGTSLRAQRSNPLTSTVDYLPPVGEPSGCFVADAPRNDAPEMTPRRAVTVTPEVRQAEVPLHLHYAWQRADWYDADASILLPMQDGEMPMTST